MNKIFENNSELLNEKTLQNMSYHLPKCQVRYITTVINLKLPTLILQSY